jgi:carbonic anhydrase/acetyltransferase-like protein (isoleucine patch superfamily)
VPDDRDKQALERSLSRTRDALARNRPAAPALFRQAPSPGPAATALGALALTLIVIAVVTGQHWLIPVALAAAAAGGLLFVVPAAQRILRELMGHGPPGQAHVGMGATVAADAVLEPGSSVEMGATIGAGATVRSGAVIRMGATVERQAVVEGGAVVSWGATVHSGAIVGEGAIVGAGSDVLSGARVPGGMWLRPGSTFGGTARPALEVARPAPVADPRAARVTAVCDKLDAELRASPERVRAFLGGSDDTIGSLRRTCEDLARRERELRAEADAAAFARLADERAGLEKRIAAERDEQIVRSLRGALSAIDEQKRQRELLRLAADRLEAEHTRLLYTLEGLASQFVRLRSAGAEAGRAPVELEQGVAQLRAELEAIADALDEVGRAAPAAALREYGEAAVTGGEPAQRPGTRTRDT